MKAGFLDKIRPRLEIVDIPEVELRVGIRTLTARERNEWSSTKENPREELLLRTLAEPDTGDRIFTDTELPLLLDLPDWVLTQLWLISLRVNKLSEQAITEMTRDFLETPRKGSSST